MDVVQQPASRTRVPTNNVSDIDGASPRIIRNRTAKQGNGLLSAAGDQLRRGVHVENVSVQPLASSGLTTGPPATAASAASADGLHRWRTDKLDVRDIAAPRIRPSSAAGARGRDTGCRSIDYSDVTLSTSAQNAGKALNFTHRRRNYLLETADIDGARPRKSSPESRHPRNPMSPRYYYDTTSLRLGSLLRDTQQAYSAWYGAFDKEKGSRPLALRRYASLASAARPPSSLRTDVFSPPQHPGSQAAMRARLHDQGTPHSTEDDAPDGPGHARPTRTSFCREVPGGRGTNPADPAYDSTGIFFRTHDGLRSSTQTRPTSAPMRRASSRAAAERLREDIAAVRSLPCW